MVTSTWRLEEGRNDRFSEGIRFSPRSLKGFGASSFEGTASINKHDFLTSFVSPFLSAEKFPRDSEVSAYFRDVTGQLGAGEDWRYLAWLRWSSCLLLTETTAIPSTEVKISTFFCHFLPNSSRTSLTRSRYCSRMEKLSFSQWCLGYSYPTTCRRKSFFVMPSCDETRER